MSKNINYQTSGPPKLWTVLFGLLIEEQNNAHVALDTFAIGFIYEYHFIEFHTSFGISGEYHVLRLYTQNQGKQPNVQVETVQHPVPEMFRLHFCAACLHELNICCVR